MASFKGPGEKGNLDIRELLAHFRGPGPLKWTKRSIRDFRSLEKGQYTISRFTNAIKIGRRRFICSAIMRIVPLYC